MSVQTKKSEYGIRTIMILAANSDQSFTQGQLAEAGNIPPKFLEQVLSALRRADLIISKRGAKGGYTLSKQPRLISVSDIIECVDGAIDLRLDKSTDSHGFVGAHSLHTCFDQLSTTVSSYLKSVTIEDLISGDNTRNMMGDGI